jgi:tripartite motif-containing protein 71
LLAIQVQVFDKHTYDYVRDVHFTFLSPYGMAFTPDGNLVVVDGDRVLVLRDSAAGGTQLVASFGSRGSGEGMFNSPRGVCVAPDGSIIVADYGNCRVQIFDKNTTFQKSFVDAYLPGVLMRPFGIACGAGGEIIVSDHRRADVSIFRAQGASLIQRISGHGDSKIHVTKPWGVAVDEHGALFVAHHCAKHGHMSMLAF